MGDPDAPLIGFSWRYGASRDTTGIVFWSDVFLHTDANGRKLAIFLVDTQGLFDNIATPAENARIFSLGTLISSVQILNLSNNIQEDQLQYLEFATEFATMVDGDDSYRGNKVFQNFIFLLRDWQNAEDFPLGFQGGEKYLETILAQPPDQNEKLRLVRQHINSSFERLQCCLLPYPGKCVATKKSYDGRWSDMEDDFRVQLKTTIETLLSPDNLLPKRINNKQVKVREMEEFIDLYFQKFNCSDVPDTMTLYEATVEKQMRNFIAKSKKKYKKVLENNRVHITLTNLHFIHDYCELVASEKLRDFLKIGRCEHKSKYEEILHDDLKTSFMEWSKFEKQIKEQEEALKLKEIENEEELLKIRRTEKEKLHGQAREEADGRYSGKEIAVEVLKIRLAKSKELKEELLKQVEVLKREKAVAFNALSRIRCFPCVIS